MNQSIMSRKLDVKTNLRCDFCHHIIPIGKQATQVIGNPEEIKCQGTYHGRFCYESALADYENKVKELNLKEEATDV